jgi:cysteine desulfurase
MWANNETGAIAPMSEIVRIAHEAGVPVHTDAVQAYGKLHIDVKKTQVDYLSLSGHKFHAPKGVGALFVSKRVRFHASMLGGGQEMGRRSGTENVASIVGMGVAAELMRNQLDGGGESRIMAMRDKFESSVLASLPGTIVNGSRKQRLATTSSLCFPGIDAAGMLILLDEKGVCCSAGSACHAAAVHPSPVLEVMGLDAAHAASTLRFSFSRFNTPEEVRTAAETVISAVRKLRDLKAEDAGPVAYSAGN